MTLRQETDAFFGGYFHQYSCTVVIDKTVLFLGGDLESSQISQLTPVGLIRIGTLPFRFTLGTCLIISRKLFLGFADLAEKSCWSR